MGTVISTNTNQMSSPEEQSSPEVSLKLTIEDLNVLLAGLNALTKSGMTLSDTAAVVCLANKLRSAAKS